MGIFNLPKMKFIHAVVLALFSTISLISSSEIRFRNRIETFGKKLNMRARFGNLMSELQGTCSTSAVDLIVGEKIKIDCTECDTSGSVWGSDLYTDDSNICSAAKFEGRSGWVRIVKKGESCGFQGETRNGKTTKFYAKCWKGTFEFE